MLSGPGAAGGRLGDRRNARLREITFLQGAAYGSCSRMTHRTPARQARKSAKHSAAAARAAAPEVPPEPEPEFEPEPAPEADPEAEVEAEAEAALDLEPDCGFAPPEDYDPAAYRWVPVRRQPRYDGWTEEKQRRFIEVLADTGLVALAAKEVGMSRTSAYRLRRAPYAGAFARAWEVARERAGSLIEDIAFERAIEGVEQNVYDGYGDLARSTTVHSDRLLTFLLRHLKPERYSREARLARLAQIPRSVRGAGQGGAGQGNAGGAVDPQPATLDDALRAMEPALPAPFAPGEDIEALAVDLATAEIADGTLPAFLAEQRRPLSEARIEADERAAQQERGRLASEKLDRKELLDDQEYDDMCVYIDPSQANEKRKKRRGDRRGDVV